VAKGVSLGTILFDRPGRERRMEGGTRREDRPMPLDPKRVQAVFWQAVQYSDPADRALILERECSGDAELWERVVALLRAHDEYTSLLNEPAFILPAWAPGLLAKPDDEVAQDTAAGRAEPAPDPTATPGGGRNGFPAGGDPRHSGGGPD
jgi:hypothetical protein